MKCRYAYLDIYKVKKVKDDFILACCVWDFANNLWDVFRFITVQLKIVAEINITIKMFSELTVFYGLKDELIILKTVFLSCVTCNLIVL